MQRHSAAGRGRQVGSATRARSRASHRTVGRVLVIDGPPRVGRFALPLVRALQTMRLDVRWLHRSSDDVVAVVQAKRVDAVLLRLGHGFGFGALVAHRLKRQLPDLPTVAYADEPDGGELARFFHLNDVLWAGSLSPQKAARLCEAMVLLSRARTKLESAIRRRPFAEAGTRLWPEPLSLDGLLLQHREAQIVGSLDRCGGWRRLPMHLGVAESTLRTWIKDYGLGARESRKAPPVRRLGTSGSSGPPLLVVCGSEMLPAPDVVARVERDRRVDVSWLRSGEDVVRAVRSISAVSVLLDAGEPRSSASGLVYAARIRQEIPSLPFVVFTRNERAGGSEPASALDVVGHLAYAESTEDALLRLAGPLAEVGRAARTLNLLKSDHRCPELKPSWPSVFLEEEETRLERSLVRAALATKPRVADAAGALMLTYLQLWKRLRRLGLRTS